MCAVLLTIAMVSDGYTSLCACLLHHLRVDQTLGRYRFKPVRCNSCYRHQRKRQSASSAVLPRLPALSEAVDLEANTIRTNMDNSVSHFLRRNAVLPENGMDLTIAVDFGNGGYLRDPAATYRSRSSAVAVQPSAQTLTLMRLPFQCDEPGE